MGNLIFLEIFIAILITLFSVFYPLFEFEPRSTENEFKPPLVGMHIALISLVFISIVFCHGFIAKYCFNYFMEFDYYIVHMAVIIFPSSIFYLIYFRKYSIEVFEDKLIVNPVFKKTTELYFDDVISAERGKFPYSILIYRKDGTKIMLFYQVENEEELLSVLFEKNVISEELFESLPRMITDAGKEVLRSLWFKALSFVLGIVFLSLSLIVVIAIKDDLFFDETRINKVRGELFEVSQPEYGSGITFILQSDTLKEYYLDFVSPTHFNESIYDEVIIDKPIELEFFKNNNWDTEIYTVAGLKQGGAYLFGRDYFFYISKTNALAGFVGGCFLFFISALFFRMAFKKKEIILDI